MEDCPKPIEIKAIKNKEKKLEIKSNKDHLFNIMFINQEKSLLINAFYNDKFSKFQYEKVYTLNEIQKVKLFTLYSNIDECLDEIFEGIDSGKCFLNEENNLIILTVPLMNKKYNQIKFTINEKEKNDKEKYEDLYNFSINLEKENIFYKNEINQLKEEIKNLKSQVEILNKKFDKFFDDEHKKNQNWIDSKIINNDNDKIKLKNWISLKDNIKSKLLYRLSLHGETIQKFHDLCDNIMNNLVIIQIDDDKKFGGYCTWVWDTSGNSLYDSNGFLFSFKKNEKFLNQNRWIHKGCKDHGPYIYSNFCFDGKMSKCIIESKDFIEQTGTFNVKEVEIYQIIFE